jgi:hypothetical protein
VEAEAAAQGGARASLTEALDIGSGEGRRWPGVGRRGLLRQWTSMTGGSRSGESGQWLVERAWPAARHT